MRNQAIPRKLLTYQCIGPHFRTNLYGSYLHSFRKTGPQSQERIDMKNHRPRRRVQCSKIKVQQRSKKRKGKSFRTFTVRRFGKASLSRDRNQFRRNRRNSRQCRNKSHRLLLNRGIQPHSGMVHWNSQHFRQR